MLSCLKVEFLSLSASCVAVSSICDAPFSNMCSTQADNNSRKLLLRCGCQFPCCPPPPPLLRVAIRGRRNPECKPKIAACTCILLVIFGTGGSACILRPSTNVQSMGCVHKLQTGSVESLKYVVTSEVRIYLLLIVILPNIPLEYLAICFVLGRGGWSPNLGLETAMIMS
jgi:hypothetical protein